MEVDSGKEWECEMGMRNISVTWKEGNTLETRGGWKPGTTWTRERNGYSKYELGMNRHLKGMGMHREWRHELQGFGEGMGTGSTVEINTHWEYHR